MSSSDAAARPPQEPVPEDGQLGAARQAGEDEDADADSYARRLGAQRGASGAITLQCARGG